MREIDCTIIRKPKVCEKVVGVIKAVAISAVSNYNPSNYDNGVFQFYPTGSIGPNFTAGLVFFPDITS